MKPQYTARIMLLLDSEWIEFKRFHRQIFPHDLRSWTIGLSAPWRIERPLADKHCISSRPVLPVYHAQRLRIKLSAAERDALEGTREYMILP